MRKALRRHERVAALLVPKRVSRLGVVLDVDRANAPSTSRTTPRPGTRLGTRTATTRSCQQRAFLTATRPCSMEVREPERRILGPQIRRRYERNSDGSAQDSENEETQEREEPHRRALGVFRNH